MICGFFFALNVKEFHQASLKKVYGVTFVNFVA
jgi:hypothetical protein